MGMPVAISMIGQLVDGPAAKTHVPFYASFVHHLVDVIRCHARLDLSCSDVQNLP